MAKIDKNGKEWKVIAFTPAGRKLHLEILKTYIDKCKILDGWQLWFNVDDQNDINYINSLENDFIQIKRLSDVDKRDNYNIYKFYQFLNDEDTIYVRLDDDIVFIEDGAIEKLVECRLDNPEPFVVFANIVNNAVVANIHQRIGALTKDYGLVTRNRFDHLTLYEIPFYTEIHNNFINKYENGKLNEYYFENELLTNNQGFSINCFAMFGKDSKFVKIPDEELEISMFQPNKLNRKNLVCGNALVSHYAFGYQRCQLNENPKIINFYKNICQK